MLENLHVKNLALDPMRSRWNSVRDSIILTGETGAGKSILLGSVNLAPGRQIFNGSAATGAKFDWWN